MAGESPDRSKQRESSAEPTSGSAGTVPEARDPRMAVARENGAPAASTASRGGVDTATRVLSVRELEIEEPERPEEPKEPEDARPEPKEPEEPKDARPEPEDARPAAEDAHPEPEDARPEAQEAPEEPEDARPARPEPEDAVAEPEDAHPEPEDARPEAQKASEEPEDARPEPEDARPEPEDARPARPEPEDAVAEAGGAEGAGDAEGSAESPSEGPEDTEADPDAVEGREDAEDATEGREDADDASESSEGAEEGNEKGPEDSTSVTSGADLRTDPRTESDHAEDDDEPAASGKPVPKWASGGEKEDEGKEGKGDKGDGEDGGDKAGAPFVDQPTAIFKAPRPKPTVDQPTTMLKLGGALKPKADEPKADEPEGDGDRTPPPAERTSRFVALKPLDEPRPPKATGDITAVTALVPQIGPERTTQQPLPPKPPIDLLAELTNTPPPPPTPLRTLGRRVKIWTPLVILLVIVFAVVQAFRPLPATALALTAKDSYTFEGGKLSLPWPDEGQGWMDGVGVGTMDSFGKQTPVAIGSVAKTMTAYVVLKDHPLKTGENGPSITVDATAEKEGGYDQSGESTLNSVKAGDKLTLQQALSAVMIPSANNIARLLARWDGGTEAAFVKKMNAAAKELGMTNTTYTDPSGLKETTVSTAEDQVKLGNAVVEIPALVTITSAASWTDPYGTNWPNYNELPYRMGAIGIKTGSTTAAGGNLLFAARKEVGGETVTVVGAILGQHKPTILKTVNEVSKTALSAAEDALASAKILKKGEVVGYVDDQLGGHTPVVVTKDVTAVGWAGLTVKLEFAADEVPHTAKAGTQVGTLTVGDGTGGAVKVPVALESDLVEPGFQDKLTRLG
ncbi:serine hydrolase [Streptomyces sp. NPDC005811]|uniref:serine hydrolase n=1 Tax=Streptomyces sp. NPDC005811 TaxID=3154565 RepID=UPI0033F3CD0A